MNRFQRIYCATVVGLPLAFGGVGSLAVEFNSPIRSGGVTRSLADPLDSDSAPAPRARRPIAAPVRRLPEVRTVESNYLRTRDALVPEMADAREARDNARPFRVADSPMEKLPKVESLDEPHLPRLPSFPPQSQPRRIPQESASNLLAPEAAESAELPVVSEHSRDAAAAEQQYVGPNPAIANFAARANELARHGISLAGRGAYFSARSEFIQALRLIAQALDQESPGAEHGRQLAAGLRALEEAKDFVPSGSRLEADLDLSSVIAAHQTPVLKEANLKQLSTLAALQDYFTFAQEQLAAAGGHEPAASLALFGLGKIHLLLSGQSTPTSRLDSPQAMVFHRAALTVDPANFRSANELGVLLAKCGQLEAAKQALLQSALASPQAEAWHNLAVVHERLGETVQAQQARYEAQLFVNSTTERRAPANDALVQWLDPKQFASISAGQEPGEQPMPNGLRTQAPPIANSPPRRTPPPWSWPNQQAARPRGQY